MPTIFLSYRREDSAGHTGRVIDRLREHFGQDQVFCDVDDIPLGHDFKQALAQAVGGCDVTIVVIGKSWLEARNPKTGIRRLDEPEDWVRLEVAEALERGIPVVPVLVQGAALPSEQDLPDVLRRLPDRQATTLMDEQWDSSVSNLLQRLDEATGHTGGWRRLISRGTILAFAVVVLGVTGMALVWWNTLFSRDASPPARAFSAPGGTAVSKTTTDVAPSMPDLVITPLAELNAPRPLDGYQAMKASAGSSSATDRGVVYPRGAQVKFELTHDRRGDATIIVRALELVVDKFVPGVQRQYAYRAKGDQIIGAGPIKPLVYQVAVTRSGAGRSMRIERGRRKGVVARSANFFDTDDRQMVQLSTKDDSQPFDVDVTAEDPGLYEISFLFTYSVLGQTRQKRSTPAISIYYDGR